MLSFIMGVDCTSSWIEETIFLHNESYVSYLRSTLPERRPQIMTDIQFIRAILDSAKSCWYS